MTDDDYGRVAFLAFWEWFPKRDNEYTGLLWEQMTPESKKPWIRAALAIRDLDEEKE